MTYNLNIDKLYREDNEDSVGSEVWNRLKNITSGNITVYFDDIEKTLVHHIKRASVCLGCVAWLTNEAILSQLSKCEVVSIVVQKEDFLRPDYRGINSKWKENQHDFKNKLESLYKALPRGVEQDDFYLDGELKSLANGIKTVRMLTDIQPECINLLSYWETKAVRSLGEVNKDKLPAFPRMHHKFLLFCDTVLTPYAVWTGSFNFTFNGTQSLENGLLITDQKIVGAYWHEWMFNLVQSEPLDWLQDEQDWLRIGY